MTRRLLFALALLGTPGGVGAEIALLSSGSTLKLDGHRFEDGLVVLELKGGGEIGLPPEAVRGFVPDEVVEEVVEEVAEGREAATGSDLERLAVAAAERHGLDPELVLAVVGVESAFKPDAVSPKGAEGLMQLMPATAASLGVEDSFDPEENLDGGTRHLGALLELYDGDVERALAAYNAGEGAVARHGGIPPFNETREYVRKVLERYREATR